MTTRIIKTYTELTMLPTFLDRFEYLKLDGMVCEETFGFERALNQAFYKSLEWKRIRDAVILRDNGCDLGIAGREIGGKIVIHHLNPVTVKDIREMSEFLINPEYLICVTPETHNAIHYGNENLMRLGVSERTRHDTCPWRH